MDFFSFIVQSHSFNSRQVDRQILSALIVLKLYFGKNDSSEMEVLQIFGSWDYKTDSWLTNYEALIPTLMPSNKVIKRIKNAWTEDDMQSALALVNSSTRSIRWIAKEVRFI